jgi:hypothetical protein
VQEDETVPNLGPASPTTHPSRTDVAAFIVGSSPLPDQQKREDRGEFPVLSSRLP